MSSGIHRKRLACVECTRRKVKCDKTLPCRNCTRKGTQCTRPRDPEHSRASSVAQLTDSLASPTASALGLIDNLQSRIKQLESDLKEATHSATEHGSAHDPLESRSAARSVSANIPSPTPITSRQPKNHSVDPPEEVEDAATILEFLAWGRRKDPNYQDAIARRESNMYRSPGDVTADDDWEDMSQLPNVSGVAMCQLLLPSQQQVRLLVRYHCECLLWYHGSFHTGTFLQELDDFYSNHNGRIESSGVDLQWTALLFSVLTGSMTCAPRSVAQSWGFRSQEQDTLSRRWLRAMTTCLHQADFMACHSLYSVEAIATLTMSAHMLGYSNGLSVLLASAVRIAQGLDLHHLGDENDERPDGLINREIGRRVWCQLCIQDWFSIPFTESYLIHRLCFNTEKPRNCNDDMLPLSEDQPTVTNYSRLFYDIAALMPDLHDDLTSSNTMYTRYEEVLKHDRRLRNLATQHLPDYLQNAPVDPAWPCYVPWARRSLAISSAHKIIMIHRKFLSLSFVNPMFEFTRKTCVAASRTIIKEQKDATRDGGPVLWIHQAFSVAASVSAHICIDQMLELTRSDHSLLGYVSPLSNGTRGFRAPTINRRRN